MSALTSIEGIGPQFAQALKEQGIGSVEKLLEAGRTRVSRMELAAASRVRQWIEQAQQLARTIEY